MAGDRRPPLSIIPARLAEYLASRNRRWTEFKNATISADIEGCHTVRLYRSRSRLQAIAGSNGLICIPEGTNCLSSGTVVPVQLLPGMPAAEPASVPV
jgi:molybdopterin biosynthesis enzyme